MQSRPIIILLLIISSGIFWYSASDDSQTITARVTRVIGGDTLTINLGQKLRLKGINTPEKSMPKFQEAKDFLEQEVGNKTIFIESHGGDKYGRILAHISTNKKYINKEILSEGLATLYYYEKDQHYTELKNAEEFARMNQKGIWKKSPDENCLKLIELKYKEPEKLTLQNQCDKELNIILKDDATHIYKETIGPNKIFTKETSHIWNDAGDTVYIWDEKGLLVFYRY